MNELARYTAVSMGVDDVSVIGGATSNDTDFASAISPRKFFLELERHKDALYRFVKRAVPEQEAVETIFSSAVLSAYENRHELKPGMSFRAWIYRALLNRCFAASRDSAGTSGLYDWTELFHEPATGDTSWRSFYGSEGALEECGDGVCSAFRRLSAPQRACLLLRLVERFSYREIAEVLELPVGTVTEHLARGRLRIRDEVVDCVRRRRMGAPTSRTDPVSKTASLARIG